MSGDNTFWLKNPSILIDKNKLDKFFPTPAMDKNEKLNAIVRFSAYLSILLVLYKNNVYYFYIFLVCIFVTFLIYQYDEENKLRENMDIYEIYKDQSNRAKNRKYVKPTYNNPFMNPTFADYKENPDRDAISRKSFIDNKEVKKEIEDKFEYNLYKDVNDVFGKNNSQRQFYTTPITTIPNDQDKFAKWLYGTNPTCKEGNGGQCIQNQSQALNQNSGPVIY